MTRALSLVSSQWAEAALAHVWTGGKGDGHLVLDPASGTDASGRVLTTKYNDFDRFRWIGSMPSRTDLFDAAHRGKWVCVEAHVRLNDPGSSNGVFDLWIDGTPEASRSGLNWVGGYTAYGINAVFFENYWNDASPVEQTRYWDNLVVSRQRIGC